MYDYLKRMVAQYYYAVFIVLALPALYAYNPHPLYFLNDDFIHVPLSQLATWGQRNSIRPFNDFSLYIDSLIWGNEAFGYHLTNLVIHLLNSILIFFVSKSILTILKIESQLKFWSVCTSLFFWGYAFHSEGVLWIIARTSCLSTFFFLICMIIFLKESRKFYQYLISYLCFFLGILTYESIIVLPILLIIFVIFFKNFRCRNNFILIVGYISLVFYYSLLRIKWTGELAGNYEAGSVNRLGVIFSNYFKLITRSFVAPQTSSCVFITSVIVFILFIVVVLLWQRDKKINADNLLFIFVVFLIPYLPYLSLGIDTHGVESERYLYLPSVFVCIFIVFFLAKMKNFKIAFSCFLFIFFYHQYYLYKSSNAYIVSGSITKMTVKIIEDNKSANNFYFINLPQENYGIPIFRLGLNEGLSWQNKIDTISQKIIIVSKNVNQLNIFKKELKIINTTSSVPMRSIGGRKNVEIKYTTDLIFVCKF